VLQENRKSAGPNQPGVLVRVRLAKGTTVMPARRSALNEMRPGTFGSDLQGKGAPDLTNREDTCHFGRLSKETCGLALKFRRGAGDGLVSHERETGGGLSHRISFERPGGFDGLQALRLRAGGVPPFLFCRIRHRGL
jgi:hypothetical protein